MSLKIRRGLASDRLSITPDEGELIYTTDTKAVYIGDGSTAGGNLISSAYIPSATWIDNASPQHIWLVQIDGTGQFYSTDLGLL